jgi:hypothetical protein
VQGVPDVGAVGRHSEVEAIQRARIKSVNDLWWGDFRRLAEERAAEEASCRTEHKADDGAGLQRVQFVWERAWRALTFLFPPTD